MTVFKNVEIHDLDYKTNEFKLTLKNNVPIEEKLHVIVVISNPCEFVRRYILLNQFIKRIQEEEDNVELYVVELAYGKQKHMVTKSNNKNHLQLRVECPLWHKENMINVAVQKLLPKDFKAFAWIDSDIEFENISWAKDTLKLLNGYKDVVQMFSHCVDMDKNETTLNLFTGFGYSYSKKKSFCTRGLDYWHPGFAWAMTRKAYKKLGGIYDKGVLGAGDNIMAYSFIHNAHKINHAKYSNDYNESMLGFQEKAKGLRLGYVPGVIRHHFHGKKKNRKYMERTDILAKHQYSPTTYISYDENGLIVPTESFPEDFKKDIMVYFYERKEDE
jgi:hypothetical protein